MSSNELDEYLQTVNDFSKQWVYKFAREYENTKHLPGTIDKKSAELSLKEMCSGSFSKNTFVSPSHLGEIIKILGFGDAAIALNLLSGLIWHSLQSRLGVELDKIPVIPYNECSFAMHGNYAGDMAYAVNSDKGELKLVKVDIASSEERNYFGLNGIVFRKYSKFDIKEIIKPVDKKNYADFLADISIFYQTILLGLLGAAIQYSRRYAKDRIAFGRPIIQFQAISQKLADMAILKETVQALHKDIFERYDDSQCFLKIFTAQYKLLAVVDNIVEESVQVMGGAGYLKDHPVEKWMRDAQVLKLMIAELGKVMNYVTEQNNN